VKKSGHVFAPETPRNRPMDAKAFKWYLCETIHRTVVIGKFKFIQAALPFGQTSDILRI
jgi:hypothetical protein